MLGKFLLTLSDDKSVVKIKDDFVEVEHIHLSLWPNWPATRGRDEDFSFSIKNGTGERVKKLISVAIEAAGYEPLL